MSVDKFWVNVTLTALQELNESVTSTEKRHCREKLELESILGFKTLTHIISAVADQITDGSHCKAALSGHVFILVAEEGWTQTKLPVNSSCMI